METLTVSMIYLNIQHSILKTFILFQAIQNQALSIKEAATLLGISYSMLYQKYRESFGKIGYKTGKRKRQDSDYDQDDVSSGDQEEKPVAPRRAKRRTKAKDVDYHDSNSEGDDDSSIHSDEEDDNMFKRSASKKPFACKVPGCDKRYNDPSNCRHHAIKIHGYDSYAKYHIKHPKQAKGFTNDKKLNAQIQEQIAEERATKKPFACPVPGCTKRYTSQIACKKHEYYHLKAAEREEGCFIPKLPPGKSAEELFAEETDPDVKKIQRTFAAQELLWKPESVRKRKKRIKTEDSDLSDDDEGDINELQSELRKFVMECNSERFKVKRAGTDFNIAPMKLHQQWFDMKKDWKYKPCFATILGVKRIQGESIDPGIVKFNGELLSACPLAWSFPQNEEEMNTQYDAVMEAYKKVLGMSEEEMHCTFTFIHAQIGGVANSAKNPKAVAKRALSSKFCRMSKADLLVELEKTSERFPLDKRTEGKADFRLQYDRCRIQLDQSLEPDEFEGIMLVAWHDDGQPIGKVLNIDDDMKMYVSTLRYVWMELRNKGAYSLPSSEHMTTCFKSVYERVLAPRLLKKLIDGTAPSRMCPTCGKVFIIKHQRDGAKFNKHVRSHEALDCDCEGIDKITTWQGRDNHKKLFHGDGKYVQCSFAECSKVIPKASVEQHNNTYHLVKIFCDLCGTTFESKKKYDYHCYTRHREVDCEVCGQKILSMNMRSHMATHRGDPLPCPQCGKEYPDQRNLNTHMRNMHTPKEEMAFHCPYHGCDKGFRDIKKFVHHLNNMHFKAYIYVCEFGCPGGKYKDHSNIRAHYRKKHGQTLSLCDKFSFAQYLKLLTEEEQVYHHSVMSKTPYYEKIMKYNC